MLESSQGILTNFCPCDIFKKHVGKAFTFCLFQVCSVQGMLQPLVITINIV